MKISIVTISYNQAEFLERTILSVINQGYDNLEYIIVDPGSKDGSRDIIEKYRSSFRHIIFEPDQGAADGLNKGFSLASGEIFGFLNSDDVLLPNALHEVNEFYQNHQDVDVVSGNVKIIDNNDQLIRYSYSDPFSSVSYAYGSCVLMQVATFFRASSYRMTDGFNKNNFSNWDGELFVDIAIKGGKFALMNKFLGCFRLHPLSITSSKKLDDKHKEYRKYIFHKIMHRDKQFFDIPAIFFSRILKYVYSPKSLYERITKGSIYGTSDK